MIQLEITASGGIQMLHDDAVDLSEFGKIKVKRASHVEFSNQTQQWEVRSAKTHSILYRAKTRALALEWEKRWYSPSGEGWAELTEVA